MMELVRLRQQQQVLPLCAQAIHVARPAICMSTLLSSMRHDSLYAAQASEQEIGKLQGRLERTEQSQRHIMAFLTKAVQEPAFLQQVLGQAGPQRLTDGEAAGAGEDSPPGPYTPPSQMQMQMQSTSLGLVMN